VEGVTGPFRDWTGHQISLRAGLRFVLSPPAKERVGLLGPKGGPADG
jgi:hypothetical protein